MMKDLKIMANGSIGKGLLCLWGVMIALLIAGYDPLASRAADKNWSGTLESELKAQFPEPSQLKDAVSSLQHNLRRIGFDPGQEDGVLGTKTKAAIDRFCSFFQNVPDHDLATAISDALAFYARIAPARERWNENAEASSFDRWRRLTLERNPTSEDLFALQADAPQWLILKRFYLYGKEHEKRWRRSWELERRHGHHFLDGSTPDTAVAYQLTVDDLTALQVRHTILKQLEALRDQQFGSKADLMAAVKPIFAEMNATYEERQKMIMQSIAKNETFVLSADALNKLKATLPQDVIEALMPIQDKPFTTEKALKDEIEKRVGQVQIKAAEYQAELIKNIETLPAYRLSEPFFADQRSKLVPIKTIEWLQAFVGLEYPGPNLFINALTAGMSMPTANQYLDRFIGQSRRFGAYSHTTPFFDTLDARDRVQQYQALVFDAARKAYRYADYEKTPIQWNGGSCGCSPESDKIVYGFYPFWMAGPEQSYNFSALSRIGYHALTFDDEGKVTQTFPWDKRRPYSKFIVDAHKYRTKIDLVVFKTDWRDWFTNSPEKRHQMADRITTELAGRVNTKLINYFSDSIKPYVSLGFSPTRTMGDGITLFFGNYPVDTAAVETFNDFVNLFKQKLSGGKLKKSLNIAFRMNALGHGAFRYPGLFALIDEENGDDAKQIETRLLVLLEEPVVNNMAQLRYEVEKRYDSRSEKVLLRKIIPVIVPYGYSEAEIEDTLIYMQDNFGGVGIWPLPPDCSDGAVAVGPGDRVDPKTLNAKLKALIFNEEPSAASRLCNILCPNRWLMRDFIFFAAVFFLIYGMLSIWLCGLRQVAKSYLGVFLLVLFSTVVVFFFTILCDPYWQDQLNIIINGFIAIIVAGIIGYIIKRKKQSDLP
jgi:hypothetical protein